MDKRINIFKILIALILSVMLIYPMTAFAEGPDRSIIGDYFNRVFFINISDGKNIFETDADVAERTQLNSDIVTGTNKTYSLYDRFGGNINFIPYFGETRIVTSVLDKFYTKLNSNEGQFKLDVSDVKKLFEEGSISNNVVYDKRPDILSQEEVLKGYVDPRMDAYSAISLNGGTAELANSILTFNKNFTFLAAVLSSTGILTLVNNIWHGVLDAGIGKFIEDIAVSVTFILAIVMIFVILAQAYKVAVGRKSIGSVVKNIGMSIVAIALIFTFASRPKIIGDTIVNVMSAVDKQFDAALSVTGDEVVKSDYTKNVREATLWETAIFNPWCKGMFGDTYNNLYTQFDTDSSHGKMKQDHDDVSSSWSDGNPRYDSATLTGDIVVPLGNKKEVRNWAALAWSTQSYFHIDAVSKAADAERTEEAAKNNSWPIATTTPNNSTIYVDNFRWIDAKLNISPEYTDAGKSTNNYTHANRYNVDFIGASLDSTHMTILLIPIIIIGLKKTVTSFKIISSSVKIMVEAAKSVFAPDNYSFAEGFRAVGRNIYDYFWWSVISFVGISLYALLNGKGVFLYEILWIIVSIQLIMFKPVRTPAQMRAVVNGIKSYGRQLANKGRNMALNLGNSLKRRVA